MRLHIRLDPALEIVGRKAGALQHPDRPVGQKLANGVRRSGDRKIDIGHQRFIVGGRQDERALPETDGPAGGEIRCAALDRDRRNRAGQVEMC